MKQILSTLILLILTSQILLAEEKLENCKFDVYSRTVVAENCKKIDEKSWLVLPCLSTEYCKVSSSVSASVQSCPMTTEPRPQAGIKINFDYRAAFVSDIAQEAKVAANRPQEQKKSKELFQQRIKESCLLSSTDTHLKRYYANRKSQGEQFIPMFAFGSFFEDLDTNTESLKAILSSEKCKSDGPQNLGFKYIQVFSKNKGEFNYINLSDLTLVPASTVYPDCN